MGAITYGIPRDLVVELARLNGSTVFVETGTLHGETTKWAAGHFNAVHTIERSDTLYEMHHRELARLEGVTPHHGDSRAVLPRVLAEIGDRRAVHWLDGHWSGGVTAGEDDECPVLDELACLAERADDIILIDDARMFLCAPPLPHKASHWPTIPEIVNALPAGRRRPLVQVIDDVIFAVPDRENLRSFLVHYAQQRATFLWEETKKARRGSPAPRDHVRGILSRVKRRLVAG